MSTKALVIIIGIAAVAILAGWYGVERLRPERAGVQQEPNSQECTALCQQGCGEFAAGEQAACAAECTAICSGADNL